MGELAPTANDRVPSRGESRRATDSYDCLVRAAALIHASARVRFKTTRTRLSGSEGTYWAVTCSSCVAARVGRKGRGKGHSGIGGFLHLSGTRGQTTMILLIILLILLLGGGGGYYGYGRWGYGGGAGVGLGTILLIVLIFYLLGAFPAGRPL